MPCSLSLCVSPTLSLSVWLTLSCCPHELQRLSESGSGRMNALRHAPRASLRAAIMISAPM